MKNFSPILQSKIDALKERRIPQKLGGISLASDLILAPMASICNAPFRLLMEDLGAGATVSELISCNGINHGNQKTLDMLKIDPREKNVGIQLFGESPEEMAKSIAVAESYGPKFIDINMGCPVKKVVQKGAGSALMKNPEKLIPYFQQIKNQTQLPVTVKIRLGWDEETLTALQVMRLAKECGLEWIAVHGRTRAQAYTGLARWDELEDLAQRSPLPFIGNGDLHRPPQVIERRQKTHCQALMLARGPLRNPFLFLLAEDVDKEYSFSASDYLEIIMRLAGYIENWFEADRVRQIQLKKHIVWFSQGFPYASKFREKIFTQPGWEETLRNTEDYFNSLGSTFQSINYEQSFMNSGHG